MQQRLFCLLLLLAGFMPAVYADHHCENLKCTYDVSLEKSGFYILGTGLNPQESDDIYTTNIENTPDTALATNIGIGVIIEQTFQPTLTFTLVERAAITIESTEFTEQVETFPLLISSDETGDVIYQNEILGTDEVITPILGEGTYNLSIASTEGIFILYIRAEGLATQSQFNVALNTDNAVSYLAANLEAGDVQFSTEFVKLAPAFSVFYQEEDGNLSLVFSSETDTNAPDNGGDDVAELPNLVIENDIELASVDFDGGISGLNLSVGLGSGAFRGDEPNTFYTVTDRGPNIPCDDTADIIGAAEFCRNPDNSVNENGKVFPIPSFTPSIYKFKLVKNPDGGIGTQQIERILLKNSSGTPITGLSNPLEVMDTEGSFSNTGQFVEYDVEGLDTEALVRLSDGTFWLAEEYAPSLVHVAADGTILERVVPAGVEGDLSAADYPITGRLPAILQKRPLNRGVESIAVSPDEQFLYFIMQSPLSNPDAAAYKASHNVRLFKLGLENGEITDVIAEYAYMIDDIVDFPLDAKINQNSVKISEMIALDADVLVILEHVTKQTKLFIVDLATGDNILNSDWDKLDTAPSFELSDVNSFAVEKQALFDSALSLPNLSSKIEGIALLDNYIVLINDNDFGISGAKTEVTLLPLVEDADASL
ncbi:esterase-like activity of phytase family protein [Candidatus Albibeggiatoa sp. nov. BB20]|uniref:esterase-like activity of phytase family protein n=1 Tax=Candidatus Albibeggiatoa sp. nov. BB20 TaxID=3162723 RepID=UPI0033658A1F